MKRIFADNPYVKEVRGRGLYAGVEFKEEFVAKGPELSMLMLANGLIAKGGTGLLGGKTIRFIPPLVMN